MRDNLIAAFGVCWIAASFGLMFYGIWISYGWWGVATPFMLLAGLLALGWAAAARIPDVE